MTLTSSRLRSGTTSDTAAHSLGVEIEGGGVVTLIEKGAPIPAQSRRLFTTVSARQPSVELHLVQWSTAPARADRIPHSAETLGRFLLSGLRLAPRGEPRVELFVEIDALGIVRAVARDLDTGAHQEETFSQVALSTRRKENPAELRSLRRRMIALINRVRKESARLSRGETHSVWKEMEDVIQKGFSSLATGTPDELAGYCSALETLLGEARSLSRTGKSQAVEGSEEAHAGRRGVGIRGA